MGAISDFLSADHDRLDDLLERAARDPAAYAGFRKGLLKHVGMEEMILLPAVKKLTGKPAALAGKIRLDHGALTALLVPSPTPAILAALQSILMPHNRLEEEPGGLYDQCELALAGEVPALLERLRQAPDIPPNAHADGERVMAVVRRALAAAGYSAALPE